MRGLGEKEQSIKITWRQNLKQFAWICETDLNEAKYNVLILGTLKGEGKIEVEWWS